MQNQSSFNHTGGWDSFNLSLHNVLLVINIIGALLHYTIWIRLFVQKTKFDLAFIFALCYIGTDLVLTTFYFIQHAIRIQSWISITPVFCYFEAYGMFYFNIYGSYCLTTLNIGRYWQIVRNQNIYMIHPRRVICSFIFFCVWILLNFIIQDLFGWCNVIEIAGASCFATYTNIFVQIWNITVILAMPIIISLFLLYRALFYIRTIHIEQTIIHHNHHRQLIVHTSIFYSIWLCLWFPLILITFLNVNQINQWVVFIGSIANTIEIAIDPMISFFIDKRFARIWKKFSQFIVSRLKLSINSQVHPAV